MASFDDVVAAVQQRYPNATREQVAQGLAAYQQSQRPVPRAPEVGDVVKEIGKQVAEQKAKGAAAKAVGEAVGAEDLGSTLGTLTSIFNIGQAIKEGRGEQAVLGGLGLAIPAAGPFFAAASILPALAGALRGAPTRTSRERNVLEALDSPRLKDALGGLSPSRQAQLLAFANARGALQFPGVDELKDGRRVVREDLYKPEFIGVQLESGEGTAARPRNVVQRESSEALRLKALRDPEGFKEERKRLESTLEGLGALQRLEEITAVEDFLKEEEKAGIQTEGREDEIQSILQGIQQDFRQKREELIDR